MSERGEFDIRRCVSHLQRQEKAFIQRDTPQNQERRKHTGIVPLTPVQARMVLRVWKYRSMFDVSGILSPSALRRQSRAKDAASRDTELTMVVFHWNPTGVTPRDVVPMTRREAHIWLRKPAIFEDNKMIAQASADQWNEYEEKNTELATDKQVLEVQGLEKQVSEKQVSEDSTQESTEEQAV